MDELKGDDFDSFVGLVALKDGVESIEEYAYDDPVERD